jgi:hypothetical protein
MLSGGDASVSNRVLFRVTSACPCAAAFFAAAIDDGNLQLDALLDADAQSAGENALERIAGIDDETSVDIAPVGFEIRVHSGKGSGE